MGFAVSEGHDRQRQVFERIGQNTPGYLVRRYMTEAKVELDERRARFVGVEAYEAAGGAVLRDLFTEDGAGWLEDIGLLDRLVQDKLDGLAENAREREGWKWASAHFEFPYGETYSRVYAQAVEPSSRRAVEPSSRRAVGGGGERHRRLVGRVRPTGRRYRGHRGAVARAGRPAGGDRRGPSGLWLGLRLYGGRSGPIRRYRHPGYLAIIPRR